MYKAVKGSIYDEKGLRLLDLTQVHCSVKFRNTAAKELAEKLNTIRQGQKIAEQQRHGAEGEW